MHTEYIKLCPLEIAGRGSRFNEKLNYCVSDAVDDLYKNIKIQLDEEYCILGFSMGGILAYELCCKLQKNGCKMPKSVLWILFQEIIFLLIQIFMKQQEQLIKICNHSK
ncbi:MAG: hypothetical protein J6A58_12345 [Oscillospiraceae bacterium]|nr:hypothetical protein [Oscillospiraceae bacterium]